VLLFDFALEDLTGEFAAAGEWLGKLESLTGAGLTGEFAAVGDWLGFPRFTGGNSIERCCGNARLLLGYTSTWKR